MNMEDIAEFLSSHNGRDKVIRTLSYTAKLAAEVVSSEETVHKLRIISGQLSACRTVLRLFDDIPMLNYAMMYGLGKEEPDRLSRVIGVLINAADLLYFPLEHVAWAAEQKLVSIRSAPWWTASTTCWAFSLYLNLIRTLRTLITLENHKKCLKAGGGDVNPVAMAQIVAQQRVQLLNVIRCGGDLIQAVHSLPEGFLWSGKLTKWQCGVLGTVTSFISLYLAYQRLLRQKSK